MLFAAGERAPQGGAGTKSKRPCRLNLSAGIEEEKRKAARKLAEEASLVTDLCSAEWRAFVDSFHSKKQDLAGLLRGKSFSSEKAAHECFDLRAAFLACHLSLPRKEGEPLGAKFPPSKKVEVGEKIFYLSRIFLENKRKACVLYTQGARTREMLSHFLYQSKSSGFWRVAPYIEPTPAGFGALAPGRLSKGSGLHYTQETTLNPALLKALERLELEGKIEELHCSSLLSAFVIPPSLVEHGPRYFTSRVRVLDLRDRALQACLTTTQKYMPGSCFIESLDAAGSSASAAGASAAGAAADPFSSIEDLQEVIGIINREISSVEGFVPHFSAEPAKSFPLTHSILGPVLIEVYPAKFGRHPLEWFMARTRDGKHIWIERISLKESSVSDYGANCTFLNSGFLTNKPVEYSHSISTKFFEFKNPQNLSEPLVVRLGESEYSLITPILDMLLPIKKFRCSLLRRPSRT